MTEIEDQQASSAPDGADNETNDVAARVALVEAEPLEQRARGFEQLHDELLAELQRSDHGTG